MTYFMKFFDLTTFLLTFFSNEICPENIPVSFFLVQSLLNIFCMVSVRFCFVLKGGEMR